MNAYEEMPLEKDERRDEVKTLLTNFMNPKILESSKICEEIIGYESLNELKEKYKLIIEESSRINEEQTTLLASLESDTTNKLIKKYDKKRQ